ncbi:MAG: FAD:protein FMN transferase [Chitinivibrionia bacterium]|nr:FAD:protein FMN transferase [Chitinivibrionia bacterium]MCL1946770.1 FAD:protein FMN transferase [Chitinivibrionia bacterium]
MKIYVFALVFLLFFIAACSPKTQKKFYFKMDTIVEITLYKNKEAKIKNDEMLKKIENFLDDWDERFSPNSANGEVLKCNNRENDTVEISEDLYKMLETALFYSQKTDGFFDITVKPLKDFWNVSEESDFLPDPQDTAILDTIAEILQNVDFRKISLLDNPKRAVFSDKKTQIDLGGIAKGFAIDKLSDTLKSYGFFNFIVNFGGDVFVSGTKDFGKPIIVGVRHPRQDELLATFEMNDGSLVTSGDYERFRLTKSGARVHHIFDTKTGFPATKNISLSIKGKRAVVSDILATGLFAMNAQEIAEKIKEFDGYDFILVDSLQNPSASKNK